MNHEPGSAMNHTSDCQANLGGTACRHPATLAEPVRLCDEHKLLVASAVLPELVSAALRDARLLNSRALPADAAHVVASAAAAPMPTTDPHQALVYFLANGGRVKIGYTKSLFTRVSSLSLREDAILLLLRGGMDLERALHAKFGAHRVADSEWFELTPDLVHFISGKSPKHHLGAKSKRPTRGNSRRQRPQQNKKAPRRSKTEWVDLAGPVFHAEFRRLRRQPTADEFATAIEAAGLGRVSESTAKNIRFEILDRTDVPALDESD